MPRRRARAERGGATNRGLVKVDEPEAGARRRSLSVARGRDQAAKPERGARLGQAVKPMSSYWRSKKPRAPTLASVSRTATICGRW